MRGRDRYLSRCGHYPFSFWMFTMLRLPGLPAKVVRRQNKRIPVDQLPNSTEKRLARTLLLPPPIWKARPPSSGPSQNIARNAGGNHWDDAFTGETPHE
jgi:hypothetical protein